MLSVCVSAAKRTIWILDNGSSFYLVSDINVLKYLQKYDGECVTVEGEVLRITKYGSVLISASVIGKIAKMRLPNIHYAKTWRGRSFDMYS